MEVSFEEYRKMMKSRNKPHKHAELIKAWADGAEIQYRFHDSAPWIDTVKPSWELGNEYRIKPKTIKYRVALMLVDGVLQTNSCSTNDIAHYYEGNKEFIRWLTDWQEIEV